MGLPQKLSAFLVSALFLSSCAAPPTAMSKADEELFQRSLKTEANKSSIASEQNLAYYNSFPSNLKDAISSYRQLIRFGALHDYDYLQEIGVRCLKQSEGEFDPEALLLSIYGAMIAKNEQLLPVLEHGLNSPYAQVQLAAIRALAEFPDDVATKILLKGLNSNFLEVCFETLFVLVSQKHPESMGYIQALMNKIPEQFHFLFPMLYALLDTPDSAKTLKKFFQHKDAQVRVEAILASAKLKRHDLLESLQILSTQHEITQQEACAYALGQFQDESSHLSLQELIKSPSEHVRLAAHYSLYRLGYSDSILPIEQMAASGNLFAIALLKECPCDEKILEALTYHPNEQIKLNAALSLLKKKNPHCLLEVRNLLIPKDPSWLLTQSVSPGKALQAKKWALFSSQTLRQAPYAKECSDQIRQEILLECSELPENVFLSLAQDIIESNQNDLIPLTISLMQSMKTQKSIDLLKSWQQKVGAPFVRAYSNLALFQLDQPGPWRDNLIEWISNEKKHPLVRLRPVVPWNSKPAKKNPFELSFEEKSQLLIESYLAIALRQEEPGLDLILSQLAHPHAKNKYALAGILIKATE